MRISKLSIRNYRGVESLDADIGTSGAVAVGGNHRGKTSVIRAIRSALSAQDIGADAIRQGADRCEILVDLEAIRVKRTITAKTSTLVVTKDGMKAQRPTEFLRELLNSSPLDPLDLLLEKDKKRRRNIVLSAIPCAVTLDQLRAWAGDETLLTDTTGHGLEVIARVRQGYYDRRTEANRVAAEAEREAERLAEVARVLPAPKGAPNEADAELAVDKAKAKASQLAYQTASAKAARERTTNVREQIAKLRASAVDARARAEAQRPTPHLVVAAERACAAVLNRLESLIREMQAAEAELAEKRKLVEEFETARAGANDLVQSAATDDRTADDLEATLAAAETPDVSPQEVTEAHARVENALHALEEAKAASARRAADEAALIAEKAAREKSAIAERLDVAVRRLTNDAPAELLAQTAAIPGLGLDGDDVTLDGKALSSLSGQEQLVFCVEIAKRLNKKSKLLVVDGLERLDPDEFGQFIAACLRDGYQVVGSRVTRGDLTLEAISHEEAEAAE